jgi:hypothetical protein
LNNLSAVFKMTAGNPMILQNPLLKRLLYKMLTAMGMSISELENAEAEITQQQQDAMIAMGMNRTIRANIDYKDVQPPGQQGLLERLGINPAPQQQEQPGQPQ